MRFVSSPCFDVDQMEMTVVLVIIVVVVFVAPLSLPFLSFLFDGKIGTSKLIELSPTSPGIFTTSGFDDGKTIRKIFIFSAC